MTVAALRRGHKTRLTGRPANLHFTYSCDATRSAPFTNAAFSPLTTGTTGTGDRGRTDGDAGGAGIRFDREGSPLQWKERGVPTRPHALHPLQPFGRGGPP